MRFVDVNPSLDRIPEIMSVSELEGLLTAQGYDPAEVTPDRKSKLIDTLSGLVFRATGQFFSEESMTLIYDGSVVDRVKMPFRLLSLTNVRIDGKTKPITDFVEYPSHIQYKDNEFTRGYKNVEVVGTFGYPDGQELPNNVYTALTILIEDYLYGDMYQRMQSRATSVGFDAMSISVKDSPYGESTGNIEADRLLSDYRWNYRPYKKKSIKMYAL